MDFRDFNEEIKIGLENAFEENDVTVRESVSDAFGKEPHAVMRISRTLQKRKLIPSAVMSADVSIEELYEDFQNGESLDHVIGRAVEEAVKGLDMLPSDDDRLHDFSWVKEHLTTSVVSAKRNGKLLRNVPHTKIDDMAEIYYVVVDSRAVIDRIGGAFRTVLIDSEMAKSLGVIASELRMHAGRTVPKREPIVYREMGKMLVATTEAVTNGAKVLAYPQFTRHVLKKTGESFWLIPSSTDEMLIFPESMGLVSYEQMKKIIAEMNEKMDGHARPLSDDAFHCSAASGIFETGESYLRRISERDVRS